jgi:hypothetical protein
MSQYPFDEYSTHQQEEKGKNMKKIAKTAYSAIGGIVLLLAGMPPIPSNAKPAPQCVSVSSLSLPGPRIISRVTNRCNVTIRLRVIIFNSPPAVCYTYPPRTSRNFVGRIIRIERCQLANETTE